MSRTTIGRCVSWACLLLLIASADSLAAGSGRGDPAIVSRLVSGRFQRFVPAWAQKWGIRRQVKGALAEVAASPRWDDATKRAAGEMGTMLQQLLGSARSIVVEHVPPGRHGGPGDRVEWISYELRGRQGERIGMIGVRHATAREPNVFGSEMTSTQDFYSLKDARSGNRFTLFLDVFRHTPESPARPTVELSSAVKQADSRYRVKAVGGSVLSRGMGNRVDNHSEEHLVETLDEEP